MNNLSKTIAGLSPEQRELLRLRIAHQAKKNLDQPRTKIVSQSREAETYPLSFAQQRLWFFDQLEPQSPAYNISIAVRLAGHLNVNALERSINMIVSRHESLRTSFLTVEGQPQQVIKPALNIKLGIINISNLSEDVEAEARHLAVHLAKIPFDLATGPLLRASLLKLAEDEHIAILSMHHIVSDGWSMGILFGEIATLYQDFVEGRDTELPELPLQYIDFAYWQREWLQGKVLQSQLSYWTEQLADLPVLQLPLDRPRRAIQSYSGARLPIVVSETLAQSLRAICKQEGVTPFMLLLAAFQILLSRYTGQEDISVGTPIANRNRGETEGLIGFFVNSLVMRGDLSGDPSFLNLLSRTRKVAIDAYGNQDLPFEKLVEVLQPDRDISSPALCQAIFVLQNAPNQTVELPGLTLSSVEVENETTKVDLTLFMWESGQTMSGALEYNVDLFEQATISRMATHFLRLLESIAADPQQRISDLRLRDDQELNHVLVECNDLRADSPSVPLHRLFEAQAGLTPQEPAVIFQQTILSYEELNCRANKLAHFLKSLGVGPETRVGLSVERSPEMIVALFAILKAGAAYVPLDPGYPPDRLLYMTQQAQVSVLLTQSHLSEKLRAPDVLSICLDSQWDRIALESADNLIEEQTVESLIYIIFTSGSTGNPKGVMVEQRSLVNYVSAMSTLFGFGPGDRVVQFASLSFDASVVQLYPTLVSGAALVLHPTPGELSNSEILHLCQQEKISMLDLPTAFWIQWIEDLASGNRVLPSSLRWFLTGGESLSTDNLNTLSRLVEGNARFLSSYGPTETTAAAKIFITDLDTVSELPYITVPLGRNIANTKTYVLDTRMKPAYIGVIGEIYIGGAGVARGYLNDPALTAERFIPDPLSNEPGARLYKTGDLGHYLPDGQIEFAGRADQQVKIRGFRVEPSEVETTLGVHTGIKNAAVVVSDEQGSRRLVAYVAASRQPAPSAGELRSFLQERLPAYMVPSAFMILDELPLTPNGKVDRRALPAIDSSLGEQGAEIALPRNQIEELIAAQWRKTLKVERVGIHDNFFELGGHSLLATQLVSAIRDSFQLEIPLRKLFETPTVAGLAETVTAAMESEEGLKTPPIQPALRGANIPLSFAQQRLWILDQIEPGSSVYNLPAALRINGKLDLDILQQAFSQIAERHESLRTTFAAVDGHPVQVIAPPSLMPLPVADLRLLPEQHREREAERLAAADAQRPFDMATGPLLRVSVICLGEEDYVVLLTIHHIISDGWSMGILIFEVAAAYATLIGETSFRFPDLPIQYADYAIWQRQWLEGESLDTHLAYWRDQLKGCPTVLELPTDKPRSAVQTFRGEMQSLYLSDSMTRALNSLCSQDSASQFMILLAAFNVLLYRYTGQSDIVVGAPVANRTHFETEGLIGFFLNSLALRTDLSGDPSFRELLARVKEMTLGAYAHQEVPFELLLDELRIERDLSRTPLYQVAFNMLNFDQPQIEQPGISMKAMAPAQRWSKFDLTVYTGEYNGQLLLEFVYNADLLQTEAMARMLAHYKAIVEAVIADPDQAISSLLLAPDTERAAQAALVSQNPKFVIFEREEIEQSIHTRFERRAEMQPGKTAVKTRNYVWSYEQLNRRANQVAQQLRALCGDGARRIALLFEHDAPMIAGVIGTLKAGMTYVPLDPSYPLDRIEFVLADSRASAVLTNDRNLALAEKLSGGKVQIVNFDSLDFTGQVDNPNLSVHPDTIAYILYTSGSTGRPKGTIQNHRNVLHFMRVYTNNLRINEDDRLTLFSSYAFDAAIMDIFGALLNGATLYPVSIKEEGLASLGDYLVENEITIYHSTPTLFRYFTQELNATRCLPNVRLIVLGGEETNKRDVAAYREHFAPSCIMVNGLGPTESTVALQYFIDHNTPVDRNSVPVGYPVAETDVLLLTEAGPQVATYGVGEIAIKSPHVALGYWDRPELNETAFIDCSGEGQRVYRTGDLGRLLPDGGIEFVGRKDFQIKIRGFRVELGEVEAAVTSHAGVRESVVVAREDGAGEKRIVAYFIADAESPVIVAELREYLKSRLPDYMLPSAFVSLEQFPLTPSGKVNRLALPAPAQEPVETRPSDLAARNPLEEVVAGIWSELLHISRLSVFDNFFDLGGHSLLATQVVSRLRELFNIELPLRRFFEAPTIAGLARQIDRARRGDGETVAPAITSRPRDGELPLSFGQQRLWFMHQMEPDTSAYNIPTAIRLTGPLDTAALEESINEIIRRHEALRTTFGSLDGKPVQRIADSQKVSLALADLRYLPQTEKMQEARRLATEEACRPFNLVAGPLLRVKLVRLDENDHVVVVVLHHIISDGWTTGVFVREIAALYDAFSKGQPSPLPDLPIQYADYAIWQREWLRGAVLDSHIAYWTGQLSGNIPALELPMSKPRPSVTGSKGMRMSKRLPAPLAASVKDLSRREGATLFMVLMAAFQTLLHRYTNQPDIIVGTNVANRNRAEIEDLIGFFVNTLPFRSNLSGNPGFRQLLSKVRETALGAFDHQNLPLEKIIDAVKPERSLSRTPLFQITFVLQNAPFSSIETSDFSITPVEFEMEVVRYDLALWMWESTDGLTATWFYNTDLFDQSVIEQIHCNFETLLQSIVAQPETRLDSLEMLTEIEKQQRISESKKIKESSRQRFLKAAPKTISKELVKSTYLEIGQSLPLVLEATRGVDIANWAEGNRKFIEAELLKHGAILFRGFDIESTGGFKQFVNTLSSQLMEYSEPTTPRHEVEAGIYTSTEYPPAQTIPLHNELSYSATCPQKIWFFCVLEAAQGGETPIADSRKVFDLIAPEIRERFTRDGVMYVRNYGDGLGLSWQQVFATTDKAEVERLCLEAGIEFEWRNGDSLRTRQVRQAITSHPDTGDKVWFNQAHLHHLTALAPELRESLLVAYGDEEFPLDMQACYGDGSAIDEFALDAIREAYRQATVTFPWRPCDILMLDNILVAHGRAPFVGPRKVVVAMSEPFTPGR